MIFETIISSIDNKNIVNFSPFGIRKIKKNPREFVAQPLEILSTIPTICENGIEPRHLDLRPFILTGKTSYVTTGGLTRVALRKGSTIVNSSQGGGSKDTMVVDA